MDLSDWLDLKSIVTGLAIAGILALANWLRRRWGRKQREHRAAWERRIPLRVGAEILATELRECAEVAEVTQRGDAYVYEAVHKLPKLRWEERQNDMSELRNDDPALWRDLDETYSAIRKAKRNNVQLPPASSLESLAARLQEIADERPP